MAKRHSGRGSGVLTSHAHRYTAIAIAVAAMALQAASVHAGENDPSMFSFSGFGSLGVAHSSESKADFNRSPKQANGVGYTRDWSGNVDSRLAGQVDAAFNDKFSAVVQVIAEYQWDGSYTPIVEWANLKYAISPAFSVRVGRIALPTTMLSETSKVAYTYHWVRPPLEVNRQLPLTNSDGVDATYRFTTGGMKHSLTAHYGQTKSKSPGDIKSEGKKMAGVADTITLGAATLHIGYLHGEAVVPFIRALPVPSLAALGKRNFKVINVAGSYDPGKWFVTSEYIRVDVPLTGNRSGWYVSGGARIGKFTPYLNYARQKQLTPPSRLSSIAAQKSTSAGLRFDPIDNVAVKLQYDHIKLGANSAGVLVPAPGFRPGGKANIVTAVVDFVF